MILYAAEHSAALIGLREALALFWSEADGFVRRRLGFSLMLLVAAGALTGLSPIALKLIVDQLASSRPVQNLVAPALLIAAYTLGQYLARSLNELRVLAHGRAEQRMQRRLSRKLFMHILRLPLRFHLDRKSGAIGQTLTMGLTGYQLILQQLLYTVVPALAELVTISVVLLHFDRPAYLLIVGVAALAYAAVFAAGVAHVAGPSQAVSFASIEAHATLTDTLLNYETVKLFDAEPAVMDKYDNVLCRTEASWLRFYRTYAFNGLAVATIFATSLGTALTLAAREVVDGTMSVGTFVLVNAYVLQMVRPLEMLGVAARNSSQGAAYLRRLLDLFHETTEPKTGMRSGSHVGDELVFDRVTFGYTPERIILKNVTFRLPAGRTVAIVGVSGTGKSSLIRLMFRLYEPDSGCILLGGTPISQLDLSALRRSIAVVPQDTVLFNDTIGNNIGLGKHASTYQEIKRAARVAHLDDLIESMPDGYDTVVGERGLKLSGGEKQRVAIARAVLRTPKIFVFDEATSSLDSRTERDILGNLIEISRTSTTLIIAHRLSTVAHADQILVLHDGLITERGTHSQLLRLNGHYAALWHAQQGDTARATEATVPADAAPMPPEARD